MSKSQKNQTVSIVLAALFTAIIAVFAQIPPSTHEFPITLQTFAIALCGYTLGIKYSLFSVTAYLLLGVAGAPVFSGFCGGFHHISGPAGGFIIAFPIFSLFCAFSFKIQRNIYKIFSGILGVCIMYVVGVLYFVLVTQTLLSAAILMYIWLFVKDVLFTLLAFYVSKIIRKRVIK